ncbi:MAG: DUF2029 domain-containing protein [Caldilinea sp.]|nr:DUF2029 domain-containing protein [Caldilinea sp.]
MDASAMQERRIRPGWDVFLLALLVFALLQIVGLAEQAALPNRLQDVLRHPILGALLPPSGYAAMGEVGPRPGEPIGLVLNALTLGALLVYALLDLALKEPQRTRLKAWLLALIVITAVVLPTGKLILLRNANGPASYTHDGGVIQTEATIQYLLAGKNPYTEDYVDTPMAEWGFSEYRTALYHYPYLPWTFVFSAPFYMVGQAIGFYDQRLVYLLLYAAMLLTASRLATGASAKLAIVAVLALNPIMALDVIFGQNDVFVLAWIVLALVCWRIGVQRRQASRRWLILSSLCFGLACASKPTAWFLAPFYGLLLVQDNEHLARQGWRGLGGAVSSLLRRVAPALLVFLVLLLPYIIWDAASLYDDVWRWSSGQGATGYQIWGWGVSNVVLGLGMVENRFSQWPFWVLQIAIAGPLLFWFVVRQIHHNTLTLACWHYAFFLFAFFYASRFLNENYLGYILAFAAIGILADDNLALDS